MFNKGVRDVLSQVNGVANSIILRYPKTVAVSDSQDMLVMVDMSELDEDDFGEIGLNDCLGGFLNLFKLFPNDPDVSIEKNVIKVSGGSMSSSFIMDEISLMGANNKSPEQFDKTEMVPSVARFDLLVDDIKKMKSATGVFKDLSEIIFTSQDGDILISLGATNKFNARSNSFSIIKSAETSKEFEIKIPVENFQKIPVSDYDFHVKYNSEKKSYRVLMINKNLSGFKIIMTVKI